MEDRFGEEKLIINIIKLLVNYCKYRELVKVVIF